MIEAVLSNWDLAGASVERLTGGEQKDVWLVDREYVLRMYPSFVPLSSVERECGWLAALGSELPEVPVPVPTVNGEIAITVDGRCAALAPFVPGRPTQAGSRSDRRAMATTLARVHRAAEHLPQDGESVHPPLRELNWDTNHWWNLESIKTVPAARELWEATRPRVAAVPNWLRVLDGLPQQVIHNDYGVVNVLIGEEDEVVSGVIDWDWATVDWRMIDVLHAIRTLTAHGMRIEDRPQEFLSDYRGAGGAITDDELAVSGELLQLQATWTALYDLGRATQGNLDEDAARYRLNTLRTIDLLAVSLKQ